MATTDATNFEPTADSWPTWFVGAAFVHTRRAGGLLILGLLLNAFVPVSLPLPWT